MISVSPHRAFPAALFFGALIALPGNAYAVWDDKIELFVSQTYTTDDNVFRISDDLDPLDVLGEPTTEDTLNVTSYGVNLDLPVSRQLFTGSYTAERARYDRFSSLDLDGHRGNISWNWVIGDRLDGELGYNETLTLASLANVQSGEQNNTANILETQSSTGTFRYKLTPAVHLVGGFTSATSDNSSDVSLISNQEKKIGEGSIRYVTRGETEFALIAANTEGDLPNLQSIGGLLVNNSYSQREYSAMIDWPITVDTNIMARGGRVERTHDELPGRDYTGNIYEVELGWRATDKLSLALVRQRIVNPYEQVNVGFVLLDSLTLRAGWRVTQKLSVNLSAIDGNRLYLGQPAFALTGEPPREEDVVLLHFHMQYQATDIFSLILDVHDDSRTSSAEFGDYDASVASLTLRAGF